jgi:hypothetical protein
MTDETGPNTTQHPEAEASITNPLRSRSSEALEAVREKLSRAADNIEIAARDGLKEVQDQVARTLAIGNAQIARAQGIVTTQARERPLGSAATYFGVGVLAGVVLGLMIATRDVRTRGRRPMSES